MRSSNPLVSVVIPAYNEEKYLPACLEALSRQTFRDFEVVVVDNNSTDRTAEIARSLGARVVHEKIQGMTPARERGFEEAKSEIIARTDADTIVPLTWLSQIYESFQKYPDIVALTGRHEFPELGIVNIPLQWFLDIGYFKFTRFIMGHHIVSGGNNAIRKSAWRKIHIHWDDSKIQEDVDLSCHLSIVGRILYCSRIVTPYSMRRWKKKFLSTFITYTLKHIRTLFMHHHTYLHYRKKYEKVVSKVKNQKAYLFLKEIRENF